MILLMLVDITNDGSCSKGDVIKAKYLYDGKYLLLHKYNDLDKVSIDMQCYDYQCVELQDICNCCSNCTNTSEFKYIRTVEADDYKLFCFECFECGQLILKKQK